MRNDRPMPVWMRALLVAALLLASAGAAQAGHGVAVVNQTGAGACLGAGFSGEGHTYRGNFTNISDVFRFNFTTTAGFNSSNVVPGDEIRVCGGLYLENVVVNKTNVTLRANNTTYDVTINASVNTSHAIHVTANDTTVQGFVVQNATGDLRAGLFVHGGGIAGGLRNVTLFRNNATQNFIGIWLNAVNDSNVSENNANRNNQSGLTIAGGNNTIAGNNASENNGNGIETGSNSDNNTIRNNLVLRNGLDGIDIMPSRLNNITGNTATGNARNGIVVEGSGLTGQLNRVTENNASANNWSGILLTVASGNIVSNNTVSLNTQHGIRIFGTSQNNTINATNRVFNNSWSGIRVEGGASGNHISFNQIWNNTVSNIYIRQSNATVISSNIINNSTTGILFSDSRDHVLRNNTFRNNSIALNLSGTTNTTVEASSLIDTLSTALHLLSGSVLRVANSTVSTSVNLNFNLSGNSSATLVNATVSPSWAPERVNVSDTSTLTRKWFLDVRVLTNEGNPISGAQVNASNATGVSAFSGATTNSTGDIPTQEVTEFVNRSGTGNNETHTPYNLTAKMTGYANNNTSLIGVTSNNWTVLLLGGDVAAPVVTLNYPNATNISYISRWTNPNLEVRINYSEFSPANVTVNVTNKTLVLANTTVCFGNASLPRPGNCTPAVVASGQDRTLVVRFAPLNNSTEGYPEGFYNISVTFFDNSSNHVTVFSNLSVVVDHTGPEVDKILANNTTRVNVTSGISVWVNFTYNETFPANYTIHITNATTSVGLLFNPSPNSTGSAPATENRSVAVFSNASDGVYNISVRVCDRAKNCTNFTNTSHWLNNSIAVDNVAPRATKELPNRSIFINNTRPTFAINFTDLGTGVNRSSLNMTVLYTNGSLTLGPLDVGCIKRVVAPIESTIGSGVCSPLQAGALSTNTITDGFGAVVAFVGVSGFDEIANNTRVFVSASATDYMRNTTTFSWNFTVDTGSPRFENLLPANNSTTGDPTPRISVDLTDLPAGPNRSTVFIQVQNNTSVWRATCDSDPANVTCSESPGVLRLVYEFNQTLGNGSQVNVTVNASDLAGNFNSTDFSINWTFRVNNDLPYAVNEIPNHTNFTNRTRPSIQVTLRDDASNLPGAVSPFPAILKVNGSVVCDNSSWGSGDCRFTPCDFTSCTLNFTPSNWGFPAGDAVSVEVAAADGAGNAMAPNFTWSFTVDPDLPDFDVATRSPASFTNRTRPTIFINATDAISGLNSSTIHMTLNNTTVLGNGCAAPLNCTAIANGFNISFAPFADDYANNTTVTVNVSVQDRAGNPNHTSWSFRVDLDAPVTAITSPVAGSFQTADFPVLATDTDNISAAGMACHYRVESYNGTAWVETLGWTSRNCNSNPTSPIVTVGAGNHCRNEGSHTCNVSFRAVDGAGNFGAVTSRTFSIDFTAPSITDQPNVTGITATAATINAGTSEPSICKYDTTDTTFDAMANTMSPTATYVLNHTASVTGTCGTTSTFYVRCRDQNGSTMTTSTSVPVTFSACAPASSPPAEAPGGGPASTPAPTATPTPTPTPTATANAAPAAMSTPILPPAAAPPPASSPSTATSPAAEEKKTISFLAKGATTEVKFSDLRLEIEGNRDLRNVEVSYTRLDRRPAGVPFPGGDTYRYFQAEAKGISPGDAKVTFTFTVERSWHARTKTSEGEIRLLRLPAGAKEWQTLDTRPGKSDAAKVEFTARSDGLSIFAIAATGSAPPGGGFPLAVVPVVVILLVLIAALRSQRMAPFWWRMRVRFRR